MRLWPFGNREEQRSIQQWPWDTSGFSQQQKTVDVERALCLVPVFGAARLLADMIAALPLSVYKKDSQGIPRLQPVPSLFYQPSVHGTEFDWKHRLVVSMALQGDGIGMVTNRDFYGYPTMLEWLNPDRVIVQDTNFAGPGSFMQPVWYWWGRRITWSANPSTSDIVHIPWFSMPYKVRGLSPIGAFAATANTGLGAEEYAAAWFENGGVPPGTFRNNKQTVTPADADIITSRITARMKSRKPLVYGNDWEYEPIAIKPNEAQFVETMRLTATQIATIYGLPPEKLGGTTGTNLTYQTLEQNNLDLLTFSLMPWLVRIENALTRLFPRPYYVKFETSELVRVDEKTRAEIDSLALGYQNGGWMDEDEVRANRNLAPLPKDRQRVAGPPQPALQQNSQQPQQNGQQPNNGNKLFPKVAAAQRKLLMSRAPEYVGAQTFRQRMISL